jgi:hypothetical protein
MQRFLTGLRLLELEGIVYWVLEESERIHDFIGTEIRKEWEADDVENGLNPKKDPWLKTLPERSWDLEITNIALIALDPAIMNYIDPQRGYIFSKSLAKRSKELQESIKEYNTIIWPVIIRKENSMLADGYCRYAALKAMNVSKIYCYVGALSKRKNK